MLQIYTVQEGIFCQKNTQLYRNLFSFTFKQAFYKRFSFSRLELHLLFIIFTFKLQHSKGLGNLGAFNHKTYNWYS